jgi:hypothetical protein
MQHSTKDADHFYPPGRRIHMKLSLAILAATIVFALSPALRAQDAPAAAPPHPGMSDHGGMMGGDMMDKGRMSEMMEQCGRMMQSMNARAAPKSPDQQPK